jgi:hypothetical protein
MGYGLESTTNTSGENVTFLQHNISTVNSTTTVLDADEVFTGTGEETNGYAAVLLSVYTSHASATDGLSIQFSHNGSDWHETDAYTVAAGAFKTYHIQPVAEYFRVVYTNGGTLQTEFHLHAAFYSVAPRGSSHRIEDDIGGQVYTNIQATDGGNLKVSVEEFDDTLVNSDGFLQTSAVGHEIEIPEGEVDGHYAVNKFGSTNNADNGIATDVWDRDAQPVWLAPTAARIHAIASSNDNDGKTAAPNSTGARTVQVYGLKTWDLAETSEVVTLDGTTPVNTANSYVIIHRMKVLTSGSGGPNIGTITATAASDSTITAQIIPLDGQTSMAIYGVPSTQSLYLASWYVAVDRDSPANAKLKARLKWTEDVESQPTVFTNKMRLSLSVNDPPHQHMFMPHNGFSGPGILKITVVADSNDSICDGGFDGYVVDK